MSRRNGRREQSVTPLWWDENACQANPVEAADSTLDAPHPQTISARTGLDPVSSQDAGEGAVERQERVVTQRSYFPSDDAAATDPADGQVDDPAAAQLATCFAIDYLSWDEAAPERREQVLRRYLAIGTPASGGWSGHGRQRATFASAGRVTTDADSAVTWVDMQVLVTRFQRRPGVPADVPAAPMTDGELASRPSSAPAPDSVAWRALDSEWVPLSVPVRRLGSSRLVIDLPAATGTDNSAYLKGV